MVSSHNLAEIQELCNHVAIMDHGQIVETGTPEQIFENPQHDRTKLFLSQILTH